MFGLNELGNTSCSLLGISASPAQSHLVQMNQATDSLLEAQRPLNCSCTQPLSRHFLPRVISLGSRRVTDKEEICPIA